MRDRGAEKARENWGGVLRGDTVKTWKKASHSSRSFEAKASLRVMREPSDEE